jgi:hypothetical protein
MISLGSRASRPHCAAGAQIFEFFLSNVFFSRFALIAGGTLAIPVNAKTDQYSDSHLQTWRRK